jgi:hypothetical protein
MILGGNANEVQMKRRPTKAQHTQPLEPILFPKLRANLAPEMIQAIGRARCWGEGGICVYHFLIVSTIDVDYHEARIDTTLTRNSADPSRGVIEKLEGRTGGNTHLGTYFGVCGNQPGERCGFLMQF